MSQVRDMNEDYRGRKGIGKRTLLFLWVSLLVWLLVGCTSIMDGRQTTFAEAEFGRVVTAGAVNEENAPQDIRSDFNRDDAMIYAVFEVKRLDPNTSLYVRWTSEPLEFEEQSTPLTADRLYENIYVEFHLEPVQGENLSGLEAGEYEVQLFINDKAGPKTKFRLIDN